MELALTRLSFSVFAFGVSLTFHRSARTCEGVFMALAHTLRDCDITAPPPPPPPRGAWIQTLFSSQIPF